MLNIIESFEFDDNILCTTIGNFNGWYQEPMLAEATKSKLNDKDVLDGFKEHIMPIMKAARM